MLWPLAHENKNLILPGSSDLKQQLPTWLNRAPNADAAVCVCVVHSSARARGWSRACCGHDGAHTVQMPGAPSLGLRATVVRCGQSLPNILRCSYDICVPVFSLLVNPPPKAKDNVPFTKVTLLTFFCVLVTGNARTAKGDPVTVRWFAWPSSHLCVPEAGMREHPC